MGTQTDRKEATSVLSPATNQQPIAILKFENWEAFNDLVGVLLGRADFLRMEDLLTIKERLLEEPAQNCQRHIASLQDKGPLQSLHELTSQLTQKVEEYARFLQIKHPPTRQLQIQTDSNYEREWYLYKYRQALWEVQRLQIDISRLRAERK